MEGGWRRGERGGGGGGEEGRHEGRPANHGGYVTGCFVEVGDVHAVCHLRSAELVNVCRHTASVPPRGWWGRGVTSPWQN